MPAAGVIATRPATAPDAAPSIDGLPLIIDSPIDHASTAQAVARKVLMKASTAVLPASSAEPALKPNQPTHSSDGADHRQRQRVRRHRFLAVADALADHVGADQAGDAALMCTTVPPAKSSAPHCQSRPALAVSSSTSFASV